MTPLEFLADVLPSPGNGFYCIAGFTPQRRMHSYFESLSEVRPQIKTWLSAGKDMYFALSTFTPQEDEEGKRFFKRRAEFAQSIKCLFIDMDGYDSKRDAALALDSFLKKTGLDVFGTPHIVSSGGGIHCYWPLTEEVDIATWKPVAENLKRLCKQEGLSIDFTVTADASRVLRIPNTFNFKPKYERPMPVKLLTVGDASVDLRRFGAVVRAQLTEAFAPASNAFLSEALNLPGKRPTKAAAKASALAEALMGNSVTSFDTIWAKSARGTGCGQLQHYLKNAEDDGMEPLWRGFLSWAKVCQDGPESAVKLSALHPYEPARMHQKMAEIKGPYACAKMDSENPGVCPSCPHWGKITNALALGREVSVDNEPKKISIPMHAGPMEQEKHIEPDVEGEDDAEDLVVPVQTRTIERPRPPKGFDYGKHSGIYRTVDLVDSAGNKSTVQLPVLAYDLFVVDTLRMEGGELHTHLTAIRPVGAENDEGERQMEYIPIIVPQKTAVSKDELLKALAAHGVLAANGKINDPHLFDYVRGSIAEATQAKRTLDVPLQFGWQKDGSFVYNNRVFKPDGTETQVPMPGLENINRVTGSKGTIEGWRKFWNLMVTRKMDEMLAMCVDSFGSSLMHFSEYEGFVWHIGSTESGTGKSLTLSAKAGVWGHPIRYRTGKGTSQVAMQQRAGMLNSMPLLIDEITTKTRNDVEWTPEFIFNISEGQGKERMEAGANKERINNSTWALTCTMTSNTHLIDVLTGARKHSSDGEVMRMLEWTPTEQLVFTDAEHTTLKELRLNYGVAGEAWARYITQNYDTCQQVWNTVHQHLKEKLKFTDAERYWHAACTSDAAAVVLLSDKYSGIINLPFNRVVTALGGFVQKARENHKRTARSAEDILNAYTRDNYGHFVVVRRGALGDLKANLGMDEATKNSTRNTVMGRIEHGVREGCVEYFIEESLMRQHCSSMSFGYTDFKRQLKAKAELEQKAGKAWSVQFDKKKNMLARTEGPSMNVIVMHLVVPITATGTEGEGEDKAPMVKS
jgi:hypothetical protein